MSIAYLGKTLEDEKDEKDENGKVGVCQKTEMETEHARGEIAIWILRNINNNNNIKK